MTSEAMAIHRLIRREIPGAHEHTDLVPEMRFFIDLPCHDLDMLELRLALEDELDITISDEEADHFTTVGDVERIVTKKLGNTP